MAQFAETPDRQRNPLGGREVDGFDQWLRVTAQTMCETEWDLPGRLRTDNPMRHVAVEASSHYGTVLGAWKAVQKGHGGDGARDRFEVYLITRVMSAYDAADFARNQGYGPDDTMADGRPMVDVSAEYMRACIILAKYVGVSELTVHACQSDQAALMALRNTRN